MSGTAQAQQAAPAGMQRIPFPTESYPHPSDPLSSKRLLNLYVESAPADSRTTTPLISSPGLLPQIVVGTGPILAVNDQYPGIWYMVSGGTAWRVRSTATGLVADSLGGVGTTSGATAIPPYARMVTIAVDNISAVFCVPPNAYTCGHNAGDPLNALGGTFPGASTVTALDGYYIFSAYPPNGQFFISQIFDPLDFDALDYATADAIPNNLLRVVTHRSDLWLFGDGGIEVWYDTGAADFPFRRRPGGVLEFPASSYMTIGHGDGSLFWLGQQNIVYRTTGYQATRISTHGIEAKIREISGGYTARSGYCYSQDGHIFYVLNFDGLTLVYDCATQKWHERSSAADGNGRWRAQWAVKYGDGVQFADNLSGQMWLGYMPGTTDAGVPIMRQAILPPDWAGTRRAFCSRLEVEMESGGDLSPGDVTLDWSDDGGRTWTGGPRTMHAGFGTEFRKRVYTTRLGSFRQRMFRITCKGHCALYAADADIQLGAS
jgi:hypothetical protein